MGRVNFSGFIDPRISERRGKHLNYNYYVVHYIWEGAWLPAGFQNKEWYSGYVELPEEHELCRAYDYELEIDPDFNFKVHGGLSISDRIEIDGRAFFAVGFDCNHMGDNFHTHNAEYVEKECLSLIEQLVEKYGY